MTSTALGWIFAGLAGVGCLYQLFALWTLGRQFRAAPQLARTNAGVTLLKPLHGAEPKLAENLGTFLDSGLNSGHSGPVQMVCGVASADDPAVKLVENLRAMRPAADIKLVTDPRRHGSNAKISNLINMMEAARHDILVLSDSDMAVGPEYLPVLLAALDQPRVGAVTCLYRGRGLAGLWSQLSASTISHVALPDMVVGHVTGIESPCMGSTIALRRETLERIGGFERFADVLADDNAMGAAVRDLGLRVDIPPMLLVHTGAESSFGQFWRQKLRWAVTIRDINFAGYCGSIVTRPVPLALLALPFAPIVGSALTLTAIILRQIVARRVDRLAGERCLPLILLPVVDCLEFIVYVAAFGARSVDWRGSRLTLASEGRIAAPTKRDT